MVKMTASAMAEEIGERLKQARLNQDLTQSDVAGLAGVARKTVINAEKGNAQLEIFIAIMMALDLTDQLDLFLPKQAISPLQLAKLQGKKRQRASGRHRNLDGGVGVCTSDTIT
jgi:putative transcriptional regulator